MAKVFERPLECQTNPAHNLPPCPRSELQSQLRYAASRQHQASPVLQAGKYKEIQGVDRNWDDAELRRLATDLTPEIDHKIESLASTRLRFRGILRASPG
jgi:hypothetical protein